MKTKTIDRILFFVVLIVAGLLILVPMAHATGQPAPTPSATSASHSAANSASNADASLYNAPSLRGGASYALASPASAAPLPSGLCPKGDSESYSIVWGLVSWAKSTTRTEMECLDKVLAMLRDTAPKPVVVNYLHPDPKPTTPPLASDNKDAHAPLAYVEKPKPAAPKKHIKAPKVCK